jgi:major intracellular serine protease
VNLLRLFPYIKTEAITIQEIPWNILQVNAPSFWGKTKGGGVVVAVIDTGCDINHSEFTSRIIKPKSFVGNHYDVTDTQGHGTHCAGTIGGKTVGVAPECRIMPLKVFADKDENPDGFEFQDAFKYILDYNKTALEDDKVRVVSCSWGGSYDGMLHYYIRQLNESGVAVVVAAGNEGDGNPETTEMLSYPGYLWEPITVGATNQDGTIAMYSSSYDGIDLACPGSYVYSAWPNGGYMKLSGTSMATPCASGALALIYAAWKQREGIYPTTKQAEDVLFKHVNRGNLAVEFVGHGFLDLTWSNTRWPLYRVQSGAYYNKSGAETTLEQIKSAGFPTYMIKY